MPLIFNFNTEGVQFVYAFWDYYQNPVFTISYCGMVIARDVNNGKLSSNSYATMYTPF